MTAAEETAYHEGKLAAHAETKYGGARCPYRRPERVAAWDRGLADGRAETPSATKSDLTPEEIEQNKAAFRSFIQTQIKA